MARNAGLFDAGLAFAVGTHATVDASYHGLFGGGEENRESGRAAGAYETAQNDADYDQDADYDDDMDYDDGGDDGTEEA